MPENHNGRCKNITVMKLLQTGADSIGACNDRKIHFYLHRGMPCIPIKVEIMQLLIEIIQEIWKIIAYY